MSFQYLMQPLSISLVAYLLFLSTTSAEDSLSWAVIGDSWASGVAYNLSNVYAPTDRQFCYRTTEAWGAQMAADNTWTTTRDQALHFAACGGSQMADVKGQFTNGGGDAHLVWAMFGGNDAGFGAIARACIYQPAEIRHPSGWGPPWDEDPDGKGECKRNIDTSNAFMDDPSRMRAQTLGAINDIFGIARGDAKYAKPTFDFYISAYVEFFNAATDACDKWTFAHARLSVGRPKLVKGLRKVINDMVAKFNRIQADIVGGYPTDATYRLHHELPSSRYAGHRFCEEGHTFEDQFYSPDVWLWNLQYYDEQKNDDSVRWVTNTDASGTMFMSAPAGIDASLPAAPPVLASDVVPGPGEAPTPQQYGFGWTARPFHPKWTGHRVLKDAFIQRMRDDNIPGVKPNLKSTPPPPPQSQNEVLNCRGLDDRHYASRDSMKAAIESQFCPEAATAGPISRRYYAGTPDEVVVSLAAPAGFKPSAPDCVLYLLGKITDLCDTTSPAGFKGGGDLSVGGATFEIRPQTLRQAAQDGNKGRCDSTWQVFWDDHVVWGKGWETNDGGKGLKGQLKGCALLPDTWHFEYGLGSDGREWTAKFRTGIFQRGCVGHAGLTAGAPSGFGCEGTG